MDLRRFLVFFVLIFFVLSINVFSNSSMYGIENITDLPWDAKEYDYIIGYNKSNGVIFIGVYRSGRAVECFNIIEDGIYDEFGNLLELYYRTYKHDVGEWSTYPAAHERAPWFENFIPIYSNKDVYNNGQIHIYGKNFDGNLGVFSGLTSSVIFGSILKPILKLIPYVLSFIVLLFTFIKAWRFVKGVF